MRAYFACQLKKYSTDTMIQMSLSLDHMMTAASAKIAVQRQAGTTDLANRPTLGRSESTLSWSNL